jgi:hypothetical protein
LDVEGLERHVFEGADRVLERTECVYFEADERNYSPCGYGIGDVIGLLTQHGFHTIHSPEAALTRDHGCATEHKRCVGTTRYGGGLLTTDDNVPLRHG